MTDLFPNKREAIQRGNPIELFGLTFYPITMAHYEDYQTCRLALLLRQTTLPATYAQMAFLDAVYALEIDRIGAKQTPTGLLERLLAGLAFALRLPINDKKGEPRFPAIDLVPNEADPRKIDGLRVRQEDNSVFINTRQFNQIRLLIATQNGDQLPDEAENPEILRAEAEYAALRESPIQYDFDNMLDSVAFHSNCPKSSLLDWTIRDFELRRKTIRRDKMYQIYTTAEMSGMVKFPNGNPYPSYEFDRDVDTPSVLKRESDVLNKFGQTAEIRQDP